jgi:hypothetical protein
LAAGPWGQLAIRNTEDDPLDISKTDQLTAAFLACTLPKPAWTHHAHLRVGLWHLLHYPPGEALPLLRNRIKRYNAATGVANTETQGYHETITRFYVWIIARFLGEVDPGQPVDALADELIRRYGDKQLPLRYYSRERLLSVEARLGWVGPDLGRLE